jgi:hypothetical protein
MPVALEVKQGVISVPSTASVEAMKAYIETGVIVLEIVSTRLIPEKKHRIEEIKENIRSNQSIECNPLDKQPG